jgi:hypothetical protein
MPSQSSPLTEKRKRKPKAVDFFDKKPTESADNNITTENSIRQLILQEAPQNLTTSFSSPPQNLTSSVTPQIPPIFGTFDIEDLYPELEWSTER